MTSYCRLCAELKDSDEIVTSITDAEKLIEQKLTVCCQWKLKYTKQKLPKDVCTVCLDKLNKCWTFVQNVKLAQHKLQELFENESDAESERVDKILPPKIVEIIFDCTDCSRAFSSRIAFEEHECNAGTVSNRCDICHQIFKNIRELRAHFKGLRCEICSQEFCKRNALKAHQEQGCEALIESPEFIENKPTFIDSGPGVSLKKELDDDDGEEISLIECGTIPPENDTSEDENVDEIDRNEESESNSNYAEISAGNETMQSESHNSSVRNETRTRQRRTRRARNTSNANDTADRIFHCYLCEKKFKKFPLLRDHLIIHTLPKALQCQYCPLRFRTQRAYTSHQKKHVDYFCDVCNKQFTSAFTLKVHKRVHVGNSAKMFGCEECDHYFVDVSAYYNHARRRHGITSAEAKKIVKILAPNGTRKPLICDQCGKDFCSKNRLYQHSFVHATECPYKCDLCPKSFKNKYQMKYHRERHINGKSFQCSVCNKRYSFKEYLVKHMKIHAGVDRKKFQCEFCDKRLTNAQSLQQHRRIHTREFPYKCDPCNYAAASRPQLMRHRESAAHMNKINESLDVQRQNA